MFERGAWVDCHYSGRIIADYGETYDVQVQMPDGMYRNFQVPKVCVESAEAVDKAADRAEEKRLKAAGQ